MADDAKLESWLQRQSRVTTGAVADYLSISRQGAHKRLRALAEAGRVIAVSAGRTAAWEVVRGEERVRYATKGIAEDRIWREWAESRPFVRSLGGPARSIVSYAFTEMLNNVIEHSGAPSVQIRMGRLKGRVWFEIEDAGVGAFERVRSARKLTSVEDALAEISKGKVTTAPEAHSGEGIFFTSKAVDRFELEANGATWIVDNARDDQTVVASRRRRGTRVRCEVEVRTERRMDEVFAKYTEDGSFSKTKIVVKLFALGTEFVSRSEARRILTGLEEFREIELDFSKVEAVGQGFADEVLRVWTRSHPEVVVTIANASRPVAFMLRRAQVAAAEQKIVLPPPAPKKRAARVKKKVVRRPL